eukprot:RCo007809
MHKPGRGLTSLETVLAIQPACQPSPPPPVIPSLLWPQPQLRLRERDGLGHCLLAAPLPASVAVHYKRDHGSYGKGCRQRDPKYVVKLRVLQQQLIGNNRNGLVGRRARPRKGPGVVRVSDHPGLHPAGRECSHPGVLAGQHGGDSARRGADLGRGGRTARKQRDLHHSDRAVAGEFGSRQRAQPLLSHNHQKQVLHRRGDRDPNRKRGPQRELCTQQVLQGGVVGVVRVRQLDWGKALSIACGKGGEGPPGATAGPKRGSPTGREHRGFLDRHVGALPGLQQSAVWLVHPHAHRAGRSRVIPSPDRPPNNHSTSRKGGDGHTHRTVGGGPRRKHEHLGGQEDREERGVQRDQANVLVLAPRHGEELRGVAQRHRGPRERSVEGGGSVAQGPYLYWVDRQRDDGYQGAIHGLPQRHSGCARVACSLNKAQEELIPGQANCSGELRQRALPHPNGLLHFYWYERVERHSEKLQLSA